MRVEESIRLITKALSFKYPQDAMMPGITIALLRNGDYYVSLLRYNPHKFVMHKTQHHNLEIALQNVAAQFVKADNHRDKNPLEVLRDAVEARGDEEYPFPAPPTKVCTSELYDYVDDYKADYEEDNYNWYSHDEF